MGENIQDIKTMDRKGSKLENQQYFENYVIFRSKNQSECCKRGLEWVNKWHEVPEEPIIDLAPLMGDKIS